MSGRGDTQGVALGWFVAGFQPYVRELWDVRTQAFSLGCHIAGFQLYWYYAGNWAANVVDVTASDLSGPKARYVTARPGGPGCRFPQKSQAL